MINECPFLQIFKNFGLLIYQRFHLFDAFSLPLQKGDFSLELLYLIQLHLS